MLIYFYVVQLNIKQLNLLPANETTAGTKSLSLARWLGQEGKGKGARRGRTYIFVCCVYVCVCALAVFILLVSSFVACHR